jgi:hypothetical protein
MSCLRRGGSQKPFLRLWEGDLCTILHLNLAESAVHDSERGDLQAIAKVLWVTSGTEAYQDHPKTLSLTKDAPKSAVRGVF